MRMSGGHSKASRAAEPPTFPIQEPSAEASGSSPHRQHPARNCLSSGHADSVQLRITGTTRKTLTELEQVRPGEESGTAHTHPRLHPASREQTLLRPRGVMSAPPSAPHPAAAPLHPPHPSPSIRPPSSGSRASLLVFRDPVLTHLRHSTLPGSPAATVSGRGRCALPSASSPLPSSPQAACTAAPRASGQCPAPPSTDPPPKAEERRLMPPLLRTGQFAPLTRWTFTQ